MTELLQSLFVDFYRLSYGDLFLLLVTATVLYLALHIKCQGNKWWKLFSSVMLLAYMAVVIYSTVGSRGATGAGQYNLIPFHSYREVRNGGNPEIYRSNLMNVVLFYPGGLLLAAVLPKKWRGWIKTALAAVCLAVLSSAIEYAQYTWQLGRVEIDDVIHNTLGALLGGLAAVYGMPLLERGKQAAVRLWKRCDAYLRERRKADS